MAEKKLNCWEYNKCEREPDGKKVAELGLCPSAVDTSFDGINSGKNAGRICWAVAGTCQGGEVHGTFAEKRESCITCDFFKMVQKEEGATTSPTKFLRFLLENENNPFLKKMTYKHIKAGERFITQGEVGDSAYVIQQGSCLVVVEKQGELHPADHRGVGDIVGEMALLTGEPRSAHVEAETDMQVWVLKKELFDEFSKEDPDLQRFLTELAAERFDTKRPVADRRIGKYVATSIAGRGGYSIIYSGVHSLLNMPVAIKMLRHDKAMDPDFSDKFRHEAKTIAQLNHENIVKVYDIEELHKTIFIIMEYLHGAPLDKILKTNPRLPYPRVTDILLQVCSGLAYAHGQGIVHQDIKPGNIFIQADGRVKIVDFGLACCPGDVDNLCWPGTVFYSSPEYIEGDPVDVRSDIYSLGITAYEMATGQKPFPEEDCAKAMNFHVHESIPDPADSRPDLPGALRDFIVKACQRDPAERYQHLTLALEDLRPLAEEYGLTGDATLAGGNKTATFFLTYKDYHQGALNELMEEFGARAQQLGMDMKMADLKDI
jgi:CRP-like cAMP-binding protein/tRNA A-37 threonylcarbamoyl transferase component Bud32